MKVYVAAPWIRKAEAQAAAEAFEAAGHTITKKWWEHREVPGYLDPAITDDALAELRLQCHEDIEGVRNCDLFVLLNLQTSEGKSVETGIAIVECKLLALVGKKSNLFHYDWNWGEYETVAECVDAFTGPYQDGNR